MFLCIDADREIGPFRPYDAAIAEYPTTPVDDEQLGAAMLYSSGTTGRPKGILRPLPEVHPAEPLPVMQFVMNMFSMRPGMRYLSPAPIYHSAPQASVATALRLGATSVIMERFDPEEFLAAVEQHRITHSQLVPTMFSRMLKLPDDARTRVRHLVAGDDHPRRRAVSGAGEGGDDRVVGAGADRVLRRHGGQRLHALRQRASGWPIEAPSASRSSASC